MHTSTNLVANVHVEPREVLLAVFDGGRNVADELEVDHAGCSFLLLVGLREWCCGVVYSSVR